MAVQKIARTHQNTLDAAGNLGEKTGTWYADWSNFFDPRYIGIPLPGTETALHVMDVGVAAGVITGRKP